MEEQCTTSANGEIRKSPIPNGKYHFTPKVVVIAGPPAAGKSYAAKRLVNEFGYKLISLDAINSVVADQYDGNIDSVRNPETFKAFRLEFVEILRHCRYQNLVLEGCRISYPHIYRAFLDSVNHRYSPFTIMQPFYLNPPRETRMEQYLLRKIKWTKNNLKGTDAKVSQSQLDKPFQEHLNPVLPGFIETPDNESIFQWAEANENSIHPGVAPEDREYFKVIAEATSFHPFYQTIELNGHILVPGFTESPRAWANILKLGVDFKGKTLCDWGCMHGYYTFKAEEAGAIGVGVDKDKGSIDLSQYLAEIKRSQCSFMVYDINTPFKQKYDIIMALNVLHRTGQFEHTTANMFRHCNECILEVGESQLSVIISESVRQGFKLKRNIPSHRQQSCIGPRRVLHMERQNKD